MSLTIVSAREALADLGRFDAIVDARSESEFAEDRLPGAINWPSLDDAERIAIGTLYKQVSPFAARKRGAVLVARNVAAHIERHLLDAAHGWTPLVYCWRGGKRSGALATVLDQIGFRVHLLEGGYREYRRAVVAALAELPARFDWRVVCGPTGSGKSRLLAELHEQGAQVLDLEALANHRGSVLGLVPGTSQPSQKEFDSRVWDTLRRLDPARPVFVESESKKVGDLRVPEALIRQMRVSRCLWLELPLAQRVALLIEDYDSSSAQRPSAPGPTRCASCAATRRSIAGSTRPAPAAPPRSSRRCWWPITIRSTSSRCAAISPASAHPPRPCAGTAAKHRCAKHRWRRSKRERFPSGHSRANAHAGGCLCRSADPQTTASGSPVAVARAGAIRQSCDGAWPRPIAPGRRGKRVGLGLRHGRGDVTSEQSGSRSQNLLAIVDPSIFRCPASMQTPPVVEQECHCCWTRHREHEVRRDVWLAARVQVPVVPVVCRKPHVKVTPPSELLPLLLVTLPSNDQPPPNVPLNPLVSPLGPACGLAPETTQASEAKPAKVTSVVSAAPTFEPVQGAAKAGAAAALRPMAATVARRRVWSFMR